MSEADNEVLVKYVVSGFIALSERDKKSVARLINDFHKNLGHSKSVRWHLELRS